MDESAHLHPVQQQQAQQHGSWEPLPQQHQQQTAGSHHVALNAVHEDEPPQNQSVGIALAVYIMVHASMNIYFPMYAEFLLRL